MREDADESVKDVMTPGVVAVRPGASLVEAARLMRDHGVGGVVVADGQRVVGMLTARDITVRALAEGVDPLTVAVGAVCTRDPPVVAPGLPVRDALTLMRERAVTRLPVVENGLPVGLVSRGDLGRRTREREAAGPRT